MTKPIQNKILFLLRALFLSLNVFILFGCIDFLDSSSIIELKMQTSLPAAPVPAKKLITLYGNINSGFCAALDNSTTQCWGANNIYGQLGATATNGFNIAKHVPELDDVKLVGRSSVQQTCFIKKDDLPYCMGNNESGQLGDGTTTSRNTAVAVAGVSGVFTDVQVQALFGCALKNDGTVWCWGNNAQGQLGDNTLVSHYAAAQVLNITTATKIEVQTSAVCALLANQTVWCWGVNTSGQLGDATLVNKKTPVQSVGVTNITNLTCGAAHCYALKTDGTVWAWGVGSLYRLGNSSTATISTPFQISGLTNIVKLYSTTASGYAIDVSGVVYSWGYNVTGQLGDGTHNNQAVPTVMAGLPANLDYLVAGTNEVCAVATNKSLTCVGAVTGSNIDNVTGNFFAPVGNLLVSSISSGMSNASCAVTTTGGLKCWGRNDNNNLNIIGTDGLYRTPTDVPGFSSGVQEVDALNTSFCFLKTDGTVWCWGTGASGQLGNNTLLNSAVAVQATGLSLVNNIESGLDHTCALKSDQTLWCWGANTFGQVGNNSPTIQKIPVQVLTSVSKFSVGRNNSCAVKTDGTAWCWGANDSGQVGNGLLTNTLVPTQVSALGITAVDIAVGYDSVCATTATNIFCWGENEFGQLGNNTFVNSLTPVQVSNLSGTITSIAGSPSGHYCVLMNEASVIKAYCWGRNGALELGSSLATGLFSSVPVLVDKISGAIASVKLSPNTTHIILTDNTLQTVGNNLLKGTGLIDSWFESFQTFFGWE
ncbi:MAG: hypothetical protein ABL930_02500 [Pseudobdellovibrio sp.]